MQVSKYSVGMGKGKKGETKGACARAARHNILIMMINARFHKGN